MMDNIFECPIRKLLDVGFLWLIFIGVSSALPMCVDLRAPQPLQAPLSFCSNDNYENKGCCNRQADSDLQRTFVSMNVSDDKCGSFLKEILCAKCNQFAADLFQIQLQEQRSVPVLCNSTLPENASAHNSTRQSYCSQVWDACQNVSILNSPFAPSLKGGASGGSANVAHTKLTEFWQSKSDFCRAFGGVVVDGESCFSGTPFVPNISQDEPPLQGVCLENIGKGAYLNMVPHPDGSNRVFLANQRGQVWLATLPDEGSGQQLELNESSPFMDLSDQVFSDATFGLLGLAFHPDFVMNGRFFASFNCDKTKNSNCLGRCACNADVGCDPSQLGADIGTMPCQYHAVIAEYTVNDTSTSPSKARFANPLEVRRIFTMGLPYVSHHAGQILFGPTDNYLYLMMGDGGNSGDPFNFAQNKKSLLGKIMRFDVDVMPSANQIDDLDLWGNYSIPFNNPYAQDKEWRPEIWALGLRNPWRCNFDSLRPTYFFCGDVGQEDYEEVDLVTKGGNYGWRVYEGMNLYNPPWSPGGNTTPSSIQPIFPILGYTHKSVNPQEGSASIIGGYLSRSNQDPCLYGRYLYADLYAAAMWAAIESPIGSGNFSAQKVPFNCSIKSAIPCTYAAQNPYPSLTYIFSFGEDNRKNLYLLANTGVYKVVHPSECNYVCKKEILITGSSGAPQTSPPPSISQSPSGSLTAMEMNKNIWLGGFLLVMFLVLK